MTNKRQILKVLKQKLDEQLPGLIQDVILFGSRVKGNFTATSDYDILIITNEKVDWKLKKRIRNVCFDISLEQEIFIDSKVISGFELDNTFWGKHPIYKDAINFGIHAR